MGDQMITGVDHITINVLDKQATLWFYGEFLDLPALGVVTLEDQEICYYELTRDCRLELIDYAIDGAVGSELEVLPAGKKDIAALQRIRGCYRHLALRTNDLDSFYQKVLNCGIPVRMEPTVMEKLGCRGILIEDPNGVEVEIVETL